ncbi:hypothetical protein PFTANZ_06336 [Plasmodium falciparum Tanzania (2000708)]|uniref:Uncharacterized protein n=1 Tax=Plasmodium falciparum Tanzania (2000708) TaxID=1036725 RepID=A0A024VXB7_PLAFA|nr:hypothetical protein PFTANZ_06336 [Plasmodium falciparum Tanzania (2000708)]
MGKGCTKCLVACSHYKNWLANQEREFTKQKEKYTNEINGSSSQKKSTPDNVNNEYDRKFYEKLKESDYGNVDKFLEKLSKEKTCTAITTEEGNINFPKNCPTETFYRSKYCQPCPECGVIKNGKTFNERNRDDIACKKKNEVYKVPKGAKTTNINFLYSGDGKQDITEKLKEFCGKVNGGTYPEDEEWECYYKDDNDNKCKMENNIKPTKKLQNSHTHPYIMTYIDFFTFWVNHMLKDSIDWRETINSCMNKARRSKCKSDCKRKCECFEKWVKKKQEEWKKIKEQYEKQDDLVNEHHS